MFGSDLWRYPWVGYLVTFILLGFCVVSVCLGVLGWDAGRVYMPYQVFAPNEGSQNVAAPPAVCAMLHPLDVWTGLPVRGVYVNRDFCSGGGFGG